MSGKGPDRKAKMNLESKSTSELLALWEKTEDEAVRREAHRIIQKRKGSDYPVGLGAMFRTGR